MLKNQLYVAAGSLKRATTNITYYETIDLSAGDLTKESISGTSWEYFPASNSYKFFVVDQLGKKKYLTNGWYEYSLANQQKNWYRFDKDGLMQRGFIAEGGKVYYLNNDDNSLGYMVTGYKDFPVSNYTAYFNTDGSLKCFVPMAARSMYENKTLSITDDMVVDDNILAVCMAAEQMNNKLLSTKKVTGQCALGNFVGYWYAFANGTKKLRFETINRELQVARYAKEGWLNVYDDNNVMYSYRFDANANLMTNALTPESVMVGADGHVAGMNLLFNYVTDKDKLELFVVASRTENNLPVAGTNLVSNVVNEDGILTNTDVATDMWTTVDLSGIDPVLSLGALRSDTNIQALQFLYAVQVANTTNTVSFANTEKAVANIENITLNTAINVVKEYKVLDASNVVNNIKTATDEVSKTNGSNIIRTCKYLMKKAISLLVA